MFGNGSIDLGSAYGSVHVDLSQVEREFNQKLSQIETGFSAQLGRLGSNIQALGGQLTLAFAPISGFVTKGVLAFADFDEILVEIAARTGASADEMERVRQVALEMGQATMFGANDAAEAMLQLLSSGYDLDQSFTALKPVLDLAAAGAIDLGFAADAVTDILAQFKLEAEQATIVTDALTRASASSSANTSDLIQAFANAGPVANLYGLSVEETAAALAVFAENGIKGSEAGTQLRSMLNNMARPTRDVQGLWKDLGVSMYDAEGNMRSLDAIIDDLNDAMDGMNDEARIGIINGLAGSYGQLGLQALLTSRGIDSMQDAMESASDAETVATKRMGAFKGVIDTLHSTLETLSINVLGPLANNYIIPLATRVTGLVDVLNEWIVVNPDIAAGLGLLLGMLAVIGPVIFGVGTYLSFAASGFAMMGAAIGFLLSPIGLLVAAMAGLVLAWTSDWAGIRTAFTETWEKFEPIFELIRDGLEEDIGNTITRVSTNAKTMLDNLEITVAKLVDTFAHLSPESIVLLGTALTVMAAPAIGAGIMAIAGAVLSLSTALGAAVLAAGPLIAVMGLVVAYENDFGGLRTSIDDTRAALKDDDWGTAAKEIGNALIAIPMGIADAILNLFDIDMEAGLAGWGVAFDSIGGIFDKFKESLDIIKNGMGDVFVALVVKASESVKPITDSLDSIKTAVSAIPDWFVGIGDAVKEKLSQPFTDAVNSIWNKLMGQGSLMELLVNLPVNVLSWLANLGESFKIPFDAVKSVIDGLLSKINSAIDKISELANKEFLGVSVNDIAGLAGGVAGLFQAEGGSYSAGDVHVVGEVGPELRVARNSGLTVANNQLATALNIVGGGVGRIAQMMDSAATAAQAQRATAGMSGGASGFGEQVINVGPINMTLNPPAGADASEYGRGVADSFANQLTARLRQVTGFTG